MPKPLEPIDVGTVTPVRRIRAVSIQTTWDDHEGGAESKISATYEYEIAYQDSAGSAILPSKHDGYVTLGNEECRANAEFMNGYSAIMAVGDARRANESATDTPA